MCCVTLRDLPKTRQKHSGASFCLKERSRWQRIPDGRLRYNASGNPGLAKGGSGDVLTGIITALLAQGLEPFDAASAGAYILGSSAESALELLHERALTAGDVLDAIEKTAGITEHRN